MSTETKRRCNGLRAHLDEIGYLIADFEDVSEEREKFLEALCAIHAKDFGLLGGDETWSVGQWHEYIREVIAEFQVIAKEVL